MFHIRLVISLLLTVAFLPRTLAGQYSSSDSGQYVILSAQYGTARRHVDVSNRLKELARQDRTFRMGNSTFGVDPDPGQVKAVRIYARGPDGRERMLSIAKAARSTAHSSAAGAAATGATNPGVAVGKAAAITAAMTATMTATPVSTSS